MAEESQDRIDRASAPDDAFAIVGICNDCAHQNNINPFACAAYPNGIPIRIFIGDVDHHTSQDGDNGIVFEPRKK